MKSSKFSAATINVGNLSMGGTGKSPHIEYLIRLLKDQHQVATLSRGFGRVERGFKIADDHSTAATIGDEPLQFYKKFKNDITVSVEANRVLGAMDLFRQQPDINVLLLDDAYQHRAIHAGLNILLTDYSHPYYSDFILPVGNLRESKIGKKRADIIIVTKCPELSEQEKEQIKRKCKPLAHQSLYFSRINYGEVLPLQGAASINLSGRKIILVTGIAKTAPLEKYIAEQAEIIHHFNYNDHHKFRASELTEIHNLFDKFANEKPLILTTEKDAMRLDTREFKALTDKYPWVYQSITVEIDNTEGFNKEVLSYVENNH